MAPRLVPRAYIRSYAKMVQAYVRITTVLYTGLSSVPAGLTMTSFRVFDDDLRISSNSFIYWLCSPVTAPNRPSGIDRSPISKKKMDASKPHRRLGATLRRWRPRVHPTERSTRLAKSRYITSTRTEKLQEATASTPLWCIRWSLYHGTGSVIGLLCNILVFESLQHGRDKCGSSFFSRHMVRSVFEA
jgi:hypothetical protein